MNGSRALGSALCQCPVVPSLGQQQSVVALDALSPAATTRANQTNGRRPPFEASLRTRLRFYSAPSQIWALCNAVIYGGRIFLQSEFLSNWARFRAHEKYSLDASDFRLILSGPSAVTSRRHACVFNCPLAEMKERLPVTPS